MIFCEITNVHESMLISVSFDSKGRTPFSKYRHPFKDTSHSWNLLIIQTKNKQKMQLLFDVCFPFNNLILLFLVARFIEIFSFRYIFHPPGEIFNFCQQLVPRCLEGNGLLDLIIYLHHCTFEPKKCNYPSLALAGGAKEQQIKFEHYSGRRSLRSFSQAQP